MEERIQKIIARSGIASRRKAETLITENRVTVNGKPAKLGDKANSNDKVEVDGIPVNKETLKYFVFYKPRSVVSTTQDEHQRKSVTDFFTKENTRLYPIGRLDYDTSGLLIMTNDGDLAQKLMHPKYKVEKEYLAKVDGTLGFDELNKLRHGIVIDGKKTAQAKAKIVKENAAKNFSLISLTIHEGRNHQVKKMFEAIGHPVTKLKRERYGNLDLIGLNSGEYRKINKKELNELLNFNEGI